MAGLWGCRKVRKNLDGTEMPVVDGEWHRVLYVNGIWLAHGLDALICRSDERVVSWYMARSETSGAWSALMGSIPASRCGSRATRGGAASEQTSSRVAP